MRKRLFGFVAMVVVGACGVQAQTTVTRIYSGAAPVASQRFAEAIWAGDTLYLSGQMASPVTAADAAKGTPAVFGDTETQATSVLDKIKTLLKTQGLTMGDVVEMQCFVAGDPAKGGKMDFAGLNAAYARFFGTAEQPNRPVRAAVQVAVRSSSAKVETVK